MIPGNLDIDIYKGCDWTDAYFIIKDSAGTVLNLTGYGAEFIVQETLDNDETDIIKLTVANGGLVATPLEGKLAPVLRQANIEDLDCTSYYWSLRLIDTNSKTFAYGRGFFTIHEIAR